MKIIREERAHHYSEFAPLFIRT